jgi:hypothetical protein
MSRLKCLASFQEAFSTTETVSSGMKARIEAVLSHANREHLQLEVNSSASVREVKAQACKQLGLIPEDHELEVVLYVPIRDSFALAQDSATGKWKQIDKKLNLRAPARLKEDQLLSELGISDSTELVLAWKLETIRRCPVCRGKMKLFCIDYHFDMFSEVLVCQGCNRADRVLIGADRDFSIEYSGSVLWHADDLLIVRVQHELVKVYELYGEAHASISAEERVRYHRETTFVNPSLERIQGTFRDRMVEALLCNPETRNLHDRTLGLRILGDAPRNPEAWAEIIKADLQKKCSRLPGPGNSAKDFLRNLAESLEALDALGASLDGSERRRLQELMLQLRNPEGAWTREIELEGDPNGDVKLPIGKYRAVLRRDSQVEPTYWAVAALNMLGVELEDRKTTIEFLHERQFPDGGFNNGPSSTPRTFLSSTLHAVEALNLLGEKPKRTRKSILWLQARQELNPILRVLGGAYGGFASGKPEIGWSELTGAKKPTKMEEPSLLFTHEAVKALSTLGARPTKVDRCISYVLEQRTRFGFGRGWSSDTLQALSVLETLDGLKEIDGLP